MSTPAETSGTPSPLSDWLEEDLAEIEAYGCPCSCKAPEGTGARHGYTCPWHRAMQSLRQGVARLTAERDAAEARAARAEEEARRYRETLVKIDDDAAHWLANEPIGQPNPYGLAIDAACRRALTEGADHHA